MRSLKIRCLGCDKRYDGDSLEEDFGEILCDELGYSGDILQEAIREYCNPDFCAQCNYEAFLTERDAFEDQVVGVQPDSETGEYRSYHEGTVDGCDDALWLHDEE